MEAILAIAKPYWFSEEKWKARGLLAVVLVLLLGVNGLNVGLSFIWRFIDTALVAKDAATFWRWISIFTGIMNASLQSYIVLSSICPIPPNPR